VFAKPPPAEPGLFTRNVLLFLAGQNVSLFGSSVVGFAIIWYITLETSSGVWITLATVCSLLPQVIISLWGGVWADRYNRKLLIMVTDGFIALATLGLAVAFWAGFRSLEMLLAISAVRSLGAGIQTPAVNAIFPQLVPREGLARIQGINQTLNSIFMLLAPAAGGAVLAFMDISWAFLIDVVTAAAAILITAFIRVKKIERASVHDSFFADLREGIVYAFRHPLLIRIIACYACSFFLFVPAGILTPLQIGRSFGGGVWRLTANEIVWTVGSLAGGVFMSLYGNFKDKPKIISLCLAAFGTAFGCLGMAGSFPVFLAIMAVAGFFFPVIATTQAVFIQEITQPAMMGRVFSIIQIVSAGAMPFGILFFGPLADIVSVESILIVSGILLVLVGALYYRSNRNIAIPYSGEPFAENSVTPPKKND